VCLSDNNESYKSSEINVTMITSNNANVDNLLGKINKSINRINPKFKTLCLKGNKSQLPSILIERVAIPDIINIILTINNYTAILDSKLLKAYNKLDPRVNQMTKLVEIWAKKKRISDGNQGYYSPFTFKLMVLFYLQHVIKPAMVPSLQQLTNQSLVNSTNLMDFFDEAISNVPDIHESSANKSNILTLLKGFYYYYSVQYFKLPKSQRTISIRTGRLLETQKVDEYLLFSIEDPFNITNNLGGKIDLSVEHEVDMAQNIVDEMVKGYTHLKERKITNLFKAKKYEI